MKLVSIIVPIYNLEDKLHICLDSICKQSYKNLQIILINDGSSDNSLSICYQYAKNDVRIEVYSHENHGVSYTRNIGLKKVIGNYVLFVDGDDKIDTDMVYQYLRRAEYTKADVVIGGIRFIENSKVTEKVLEDKVLTRKELCQRLCCDTSGIFGYVPNKLYKTSIIRDNSICFKENMTVQEDFEFALSVYRCLEKAALLNYSGYSYYYVSEKRYIPIKDIINNQLKLLAISKSNNLENLYIQMVENKVCSLLYTTLFWTNSLEKIKEYAEFSEPFITKFSSSGNTYKVKMIIRLLKKKKYLQIYNIFYVWKILRRKLRK